MIGDRCGPAKPELPDDDKSQSDATYKEHLSTLIRSVAISADGCSNVAQLLTAGSQTQAGNASFLCSWQRRWINLVVDELIRKDDITRPMLELSKRCIV